MKMRYKEVNVRFAQGTSEVRKIIPEWEVPVLMAVNEEITEIRDFVVDREPPSVSVEMERLKKVYGEDKNEKGEFTGVPVAVAVYGQHAIGTRALKEAMQSTVLPNKTPVTPYDVSPPMRQDLLQALTDTPSEISDLIGADDGEIEEVKAAYEEVEVA